MLNVIYIENAHLKSFIRDSNLCSSTLYVWYSLCYTEQKGKRYTTIFYILWESIGRKEFTKLIMFSRHPANDSLKLHQFISFDVWVMFPYVFKALFTGLCKCACAKKLLRFSELSYFCFIKAQKLSYHLKQAQKSILNLSNLWKIVNCLPLTKTNREY